MIVGGLEGERRKVQVGGGGFEDERGNGREDEANRRPGHSTDANQDTRVPGVAVVLKGAGS